jgi:glutaminyl-peptide cyclotransferase
MRLPRLGILFAAAMVVFGARARADIPVYGYTVVQTYPHDSHAFTEGLLYHDGFLFESTGEPGRSTIRKVRLNDGVVLQSVSIPAPIFGEGIVDWKDEIVSLTWRDGIGWRWDLKTFKRLGEFHYAGEGWALTQDGTDIIMSDGTPTLRILDPRTLTERRRLTVTADGQPVANLNEIEWVKGEIYANIWMTSRIARINPMTGRVIGWIDLSGLPETIVTVDRDAVANGIAYDNDHDRLFITGKRWPHLYEIRLTPPR